MKKKVKTIKKETNSSRKEGQFGAILENMNSKIDLLLELHDISDKKMDRLHQEVKEDLNEFKIETRNNFKMVYKKFDEIDEKFNGIDGNFKKVFEFQERVEANFKSPLNIFHVWMMKYSLCART